MYSKTVMDHFRNPRNVGVIEDADGIGEVGNPLCGDMMTLYIKVEQDRIKDIKFQTFGCGSAIAVSSMLTEIAMGQEIESAKKITNKDVAQALEGLPKNKLHCSNLGADALHLAIRNYEAIVHYTCAEGDQGATLRLSVEGADSVSTKVVEVFDPPLYDKSKERGQVALFRERLQAAQAGHVTP